MVISFRECQDCPPRDCPLGGNSFWSDLHRHQVWWETPAPGLWWKLFSWIWCQPCEGHWKQLILPTPPPHMLIGGWKSLRLLRRKLPTSFSPNTAFKGHPALMKVVLMNLMPTVWRTSQTVNLANTPHVDWCLGTSETLSRETFRFF